MKTLSSWKSLAVAAGAVLALTPGVAHAAPITYSVNEGNVPGANPTTITVNDITGKYEEALSLSGGPSGTFTANLIVNFAGYVLNGAPVTSQLGAIDPIDEATNSNLYSLYALVTVSGTYSTIPLGGTQSLINFAPTASTADIWTDPLRNTVQDYTTASVTSNAGDDQHIMTASAILGSPLSNGHVFLDAGIVTGGSYALVYTNPTLVSPNGPLYWPDLALLTLTATASGDVDPTSGSTGTFPNDIVGDTDITFTPAATVPEPASLALLGVGLLGACLGARRRRNVR